MYNGQTTEHGQYTVNISGAEVDGAFSWGPQIKFCLGPHKASGRLCCKYMDVNEYEGKPALFIEMVCLLLFLPYSHSLFICFSL